MYSSKSIWITGADGKLGSVLKRVLKGNVEYRIVTTDTDVDVSDYEAVQRAMDIYKPNIVINCAGIDKEASKKDEILAYKVNAIGARNLAIATRSHNAKIIHISTDDVFKYHSEGKYNEFDLAMPKGIYGKSKLAGENFIRELNPKHLIIRSSWVYGKGNEDYFSYVVDKAQKNESFEASKDVIGTPTNCETLAKFILSIFDKNEYGIYHVSDEGFCSRFEFALFILTKMGYDPNLVQGVFTQGGKISSTVLDNLMMRITQVYSMPDWKEDLETYIKGQKGE